MVREREAKGPAQSPEMGEANGQPKHPAPCTHTSLSTGTKTFLNKTQVDTQEEKPQLPNSWGKTGQSEKSV